MWLIEIRGKEPYQNSNFPLVYSLLFIFNFTCQPDSHIVIA